MEKKKLLTRKEFEDLRTKAAETMAADTELRKEAFELQSRARRHYWIHQTNWFGEPILQLPQDMFALQEIIFNTRPKFIIEIGVAWGGSLLFYSTLMDVLGGEKIIGVDIYIPEDLKQRLSSHGRLSDRIELITGSSVAQDTIARIHEIIGTCRETLVVLDSHHTHEHALHELRLYSPLVGKGCYIACCDTVIEYEPEAGHQSRPWGHGNNPKTALDQFLKENDRFQVNSAIDRKLLFTCNPGGYLLAVKD